MNTNNCYTAYSWRVFQNNRFVGYIVSFSQTDALRKAQEKYGDHIWIERITAP